MWWRLPLDYKLSLHATFAVPVLQQQQPSCYAVQLAIRRHASQLRTSVAYHVQQAPRSTLRPTDAHAALERQWVQLSATQKAISLGFLVDDPFFPLGISEQLPPFIGYRSVFCDYLAAVAAAAAAKNMTRN